MSADQLYLIIDLYFNEINKLLLKLLKLLKYTNIDLGHNDSKIILFLHYILLHKMIRGFFFR